MGLASLSAELSMHSEPRVRPAVAERAGVTIASWPRLMSLEITAAYTSLGVSTWRDYVADHLIEPVAMPGSTLRDSHGHIVVHGKDRRIGKILLDREDVDELIHKMKTEGTGRD